MAAVAFEALEDGVALAVHGQEVSRFPFATSVTALPAMTRILAGDGEVHATLGWPRGRGRALAVPTMASEDHVGPQAFTRSMRPWVPVRRRRRPGAAPVYAPAASVRATCFTPVSMACWTRHRRCHSPQGRRSACAGEVTGHFESAGADGTGGADDARAMKRVAAVGLRRTNELRKE